MYYGLIGPEQGDLECRADEALGSQVYWLLPLQNRPSYIGREKRQTNKARNVCPVKPLRPSDVADSPCLSANDPTPPLVGASNCFNEIGIGLSSSRLLIKNNELRFNASPPKPDRHLDQDRRMTSPFCLRSRLSVQNTLNQAIMVDFNRHFVLCNRYAAHESGNDLQMACE